MKIEGWISKQAYSFVNRLQVIIMDKDHITIRHLLWGTCYTKIHTQGDLIIILTSAIWADSV